MNQNEKLACIVKALDSKKALDITVIEIKDLTIIADYFVVASGTSNTHVKTLTDEVEFNLKQIDDAQIRIEGHNNSDWILIDCNDIVVHVFRNDIREYYSLERLWNDGKKVDISNLLQ